MQPLEELPPNRPNFKLVVILFAVSIVVILVLAILFLRRDASHMEPSGRPSPQSRLQRHDGSANIVQS